MPKNIVICCDGTDNQIEADLSNVLKAYRTFAKNSNQLVHYSPGIGTLGQHNYWLRRWNAFKRVLGLLTGYGLDRDILEAYRFLVDQYEDGDRIYLFGFSRGAYTVRALAGLLKLIGLLEPRQKNLCGYALTAYKKASDNDDFTIAWRFERVMDTRRVPIKFIGVWDTVSSVIVPRRDRFLWLPTFQTLPYTATNPFVEIFRQAIAIDERRRMFRINRWTEPQPFQPNPFDPSEPDPQDILQLWFTGAHSDVGGGYPEDESGLAKFSLKWLLDEAREHGVQLHTQMYNHLVLGHERKGASRNYVKPDAAARRHKSMTWGWWILEVLPRSAKRRDWSRRRTLLGFYIPFAEPRLIPEGALIHHSVERRMKAVSSYQPKNLPETYQIEEENGKKA